MLGPHLQMFYSFPPSRHKLLPYAGNKETSGYEAQSKIDIPSRCGRSHQPEGVKRTTGGPSQSVHRQLGWRKGKVQ